MVTEREVLIDRIKVLEGVRKLMEQHHEKMDGATTVPTEIKSRAEGYLEALYQVENVIINS